MPDVKDFIPEAICLGVDLVLCGILAKFASSMSTVIENLKAAPEIIINEDLKKQILEKGDVSGDKHIVPYAVVRGDVNPLGKLITSSYAASPVYGVIQKVVFTEHKRNLSRAGFWFDSERILHQYTNEAPFCLIKPQSQSGWSMSRPNVEVINWSDATRIDLDTIFDKFEAAEGGLKNHVVGFMTGDMHKGTQVTETMLTKGSCMTAVGELVSGPMGVQLQPPSDGKPLFIVRNTVSSLIKEYEEGRSKMKIFLFLFGGVGAGIVAYIAYKFFMKRKAELEARANQEVLSRIISGRENRRRASITNRDSPGDEQTGAERLQCVICLTAEREVILLNCGHVCVCAGCGSELIRLNSHCPICRSDINSILPAYVS